MNKVLLYTLLLSFVVTVVKAQVVSFHPIIKGNLISVNVLSEVFNCENDWQKLGLKGAVKSIAKEGTVFRFNPLGFFTEVMEYDTKYIFQYNERGKLISCTNIRRGELHEKKIYNYDTSGRLISYGTNRALHKCLYNDQGIIVKTEASYNDIQTYNSRGQLIHNTISSSPSFKYNGNDQCFSCTKEEEGMDIIDVTTSSFTYDKEGNIIKCIRSITPYDEELDKDGRSKKGKKRETYATTETYEYQYDHTGNWTSCTDNNGKTVKRTIVYY